MWNVLNLQTTLHLTRQSHGHLSNCKHQTPCLPDCCTDTTIAVEVARMLKAQIVAPRHFCKAEVALGFKPKAVTKSRSATIQLPLETVNGYKLICSPINLPPSSQLTQKHGQACSSSG